MPNIKTGQQITPLGPKFSDLAEKHSDHETALIALSSAQEEITELKDARREERIGWIVTCVILFDCAFLLNAENATGPVIIGLLQIGVLAVMAKRLGVEEFYALFANMTNRIGNILGGKGD